MNNNNNKFIKREQLRYKICFPNEGIKINYDFMINSYYVYLGVINNLELLQRDPNTYYIYKELCKQIYLNNLRIYKDNLV